jgi:hypothetical protein
MSQTKYKPLHQLYEDKRQTRKSASNEDHSVVSRLVHDRYKLTGYGVGYVLKKKHEIFTSQN